MPDKRQICTYTPGMLTLLKSCLFDLYTILIIEDIGEPRRSTEPVNILDFPWRITRPIVVRVR